jgi:hypothetical protein
MTRDILFWSDDVPITQSDSTVYAPPLRGVLCLATGDLSIVTAGGQTVTFTVPYAGFVAPYMVSRVLDTGTTIADASLRGGR